MRAVSTCCLMLCLLHLGNLVGPAASAEEVDYEQLLQRYLRGESSLEQQILNSPAVLPALEQYQAQPTRNPQVETWIKELGDASFSKRENASKQLLQTLPYSKKIIETAVEETKDPEIRRRLKLLLSHATVSKDAREAVPQLLRAMYARHLPEIWQEYLELLEQDPHNPRALSLIRFTDPEVLLKLSDEKINPALKLRYYLALKFVDNSLSRSTERMQEFTGEEILKAASKTYWPVELHALSRDGTYHWTARCGRLEKNRADDVLYMSIDQNDYDRINSQPVKADKSTGRTKPPGNMVHFTTWARWDYLFRFETKYSGTYAGVALTSTHSGSFRPKLVQEIPSKIQIASTRVERTEILHWALGKQYSWAKELYPEDLVDKVSFIEGSSTSQIVREGAVKKE